MHQHKAKTSKDYGFNGPVTSEVSGYYAQNPAAHGNICRVDTCRCGAIRRTNINQGHVERGRWIMPEED